MNKKVKKLWVSALRSNEFKQTKGYLSHSGNYCCLGVLSCLAEREKVCSRRKAFEGNVGLPNVVMDWAGINHKEVKIHKLKTCLTDLNDNKGKTFFEIADIIEKYL